MSLEVIELEQPEMMVGLQLHEDIDIGIRAELPTSRRTEQSHHPDLIPAAQIGDLLG